MVVLEAHVGSKLYGLNGNAFSFGTACSVNNVPASRRRRPTVSLQNAAYSTRRSRAISGMPCRRLR